MIPGLFRLGLVKAFGWPIYHMGIPAGTTYTVRVPARTHRGDIPIRTLWTIGRISSRSDAFQMPDRIPGMLHSDLPDPPEGTYHLRAEVDTEWWCANRKYTNGTVPEIGKVLVAAGESSIVPAGTRLLVCLGGGSLGAEEVGPGFSLHTPEDMELRGATDLICMTFDKSMET